MRQRHEDGQITTELLDGGIFSICIDRAEKRNGFTPKMLLELAEAYSALDESAEARVGLLQAAGGHFTGGLDLPKMAAFQQTGEPLFPDHLVDPLGLNGRARVKPVVVATAGICFTIGIELILAADIAVAADNSRFAQLEVKRGIMAYGGATIRMAQRAGWGNAMKLILTGDDFDAATAKDYGFVQEIVPAGQEVEAALAICRRIAAQAPLAVQASIASARLALLEGPRAAIADFPVVTARLAATEDAAEGVASFKEKRPPAYRGK
ncbi:crotonase/enoyl-CoA hydratase family protein [Zavarzinia sp.]|uniref:crotonase/enoyl-CoA hydratase family protein n=1 Tax=Zavarzinia sp. TaxID=2027920 RepID=UPI00356807DE